MPEAQVQATLSKPERKALVAAAKGDFWSHLAIAQQIHSEVPGHGDLYYRAIHGDTIAAEELAAF
jgi:hypothetical protein